MEIITLTTDLGHKDFYQAALKGSILSILPDVRIVDISHEIPSYDIKKAAFIFCNAYPYFPKNTVHLLGIDTVVNQNSKYLAMQFNNHYFVGSDNGLFSMILGESDPQELVEIDIMQDLRYLHFPLVDILAKTACHIATGNQLIEIGTPYSQLNIKTTLQPIHDQKSIKGHVSYIDSFGNVISNISKELFNRVQKGRDFTLKFKHKESIQKMSWHYSEVPEGEKLCLFGISNFLEIAINKGQANLLLGLLQDETIIVEFHDNSSK